MNFLFIGPQRTGTTWVYEQLKNHPELCFPKDVKETMFFDQYYEKGLDWYWWHFQNCENKQLVGEVAPTYFDDDKAAKRIYSVNPDCEIFITLRNPVERARSLFQHHLRKGRVDKDFSNAVDTLPRIISAGKYSEHMKRWMSLFDDEKLHVFFLEDIKKNPQNVLDEISDLLEIQTVTLNNSNGKVNKATMPQNMLLARYGAKLATFLRKQRLHKIVELGKKLGLKSIFTGNEQELPGLSIQEKENLIDYYKEDINFVEKISNRDFSNWKTIQKN